MEIWKDLLLKNKKGTEFVNARTISETDRCNLTEYLTKRTFQRENIREEVGNDGKPREIKGFGEFDREKMKHL